MKHAFIENLANQQMAFILVDEVQDYTEAQLLLLLTLFPKASFTLVVMKIKPFLIQPLNFLKPMIYWLTKPAVLLEPINY